MAVSILFNGPKADTNTPREYKLYGWHWLAKAWLSTTYSQISNGTRATQYEYIWRYADDKPVNKR